MRKQRRADGWFSVLHRQTMEQANPRRTSCTSSMARGTCPTRRDNRGIKRMVISRSSATCSSKSAISCSHRARCDRDSVCSSDRRETTMGIGLKNGIDRRTLLKQGSWTARRAVGIAKNRSEGRQRADHRRFHRRRHHG